MSDGVRSVRADPSAGADWLRTTPAAAALPHRDPDSQPGQASGRRVKTRASLDRGATHRGLDASFGGRTIRWRGRGTHACAQRSGCARTARLRRPQRGAPRSGARAGGAGALEPVRKVVTGSVGCHCAPSADVRHLPPPDALHPERPDMAPLCVKSRAHADGGRGRSRLTAPGPAQVPAQSLGVRRSQWAASHSRLRTWLSSAGRSKDSTLFIPRPRFSLLSVDLLVSGCLLSGESWSTLMPRDRVIEKVMAGDASNSIASRIA